jgi:hypothetical protein
MIRINGILKNICRPAIFVALSLICIIINGQESLDVVKKTGTQEKINDVNFYDSLKVKAGKNRFAHKIYDLVIVNTDQTVAKNTTSSNVETFTTYKGKIIRNIEINRLDVFGTDINNPSSQNTSRINKLLNRTHVNTNERIIRKYLLFSSGDAISPLILSDNERIIRQLPFIEDARIVIVPVSESEADIIVVVKDVYSLGIDYSFKSLEKGTARLFERNIFGIGHELEFVVPYDSHYKDSPGFGANYKINNIASTFTNLQFNFLDGLGRKTYGVNISRDFLSYTTKYAGGIAIRKTFTTVDLDTLPVPEPLEYTFQDYWAAKSFLINEESVTRIIIGARFTNNNIFARPVINSNSYHNLQNYKLFLGSAALSIQKYYKTNLIYSYGRTEDIPYGGLFRVTAGREFNEFKVRTYVSADASVGKLFSSLGYIYLNASYSTFLKGKALEQGLVSLRANHFSNLYKIGRFQMRNFIYLDYTRGISRYTDEYLYVDNRNGMSGFSNDSLKGTRRVMLNLESVVFSPLNIYGFRFAFFGFANMALVTPQAVDSNKVFLSGLGLGVRIRNDNLVLSTFQIRLGYFPNPPLYSNLSYLKISGEQVLRPSNFDTGPPEVFGFR